MFVFRYTVPAILAGRKTQSRRLATDLRVRLRMGNCDGPGGTTPVRVDDDGSVYQTVGGHDLTQLRSGDFDFVIPGIHGPMDTFRDSLTWTAVPIITAGGWRVMTAEPFRTRARPDGARGILYKSDEMFLPVQQSHHSDRRWHEIHDSGKHGLSWRSAREQPRWASRATLRILEVRLQPLLNTTEADAMAEGVPDPDVSQFLPGGKPRLWELLKIWKRIHPNREPFIERPWVWAYTFRVDARKEESLG